MVQQVGDFMAPGAPAPTPAQTPSPAPNPGKPATAAPASTPDQDREKLKKKWKIALAGAVHEPNSRQRIAALLRGSRRPGAQRVGQIHSDLDTAAAENATRAQQAEQHEAGLDRTAAEIQQRDATAGAESARQRRESAAATEAEYRNQHLETTVDLEQKGKRAAITLDQARAAALEAEAELDRMQRDNPAMLAQSNLGYMATILQGVGLSPAMAAMQAQDILSSPSIAEVRQKMVQSYSENAFLVDEEGKPLDNDTKVEMGLESAERIISRIPRLNAMANYPDVVEALQGTAHLTKFMSADPATQAEFAKQVRKKVAGRPGTAPSAPASSPRPPLDQGAMPPT